MQMLKQTAAKFFIQLKLKKSNFSNKSFSSAFKNSSSILILMPEDDKDFQYAVNILSYLDKLKKEIFILTNDYRVSLLPLHFRGKALGHGIKDINQMDLPSKRLLSELLKKKFDTLLDLNRKEQLFYIYVSGIVNAEMSIGFTKSLADKVYNLQIVNSETNPKISYENLLNCLKML
jgi:Family of unknown function (DUF6913)